MNTIIIDKARGIATITIPLQDLTPSTSGKTLLFINRNGNNAVYGEYEGKKATVTITGYIKA